MGSRAGTGQDSLASSPLRSSVVAAEGGLTAHRHARRATARASCRLNGGRALTPPRAPIPAWSAAWRSNPMRARLGVGLGIGSTLRTLANGNANAGPGERRGVGDKVESAKGGDFELANTEDVELVIDIVISSGISCCRYL